MTPMKKRRLTIKTTTIRSLTSRQIRSAVGGALFDDVPYTWGVSGPERQPSDTCSWGCSHTCSNYESCA